MKVSTLLMAAYLELVKASNGIIEDSKIGPLSSTIHKYAIYSAVSASFSLAPGIGAIVTALSQTGLVWGTYVAINKELGISLKENVLKFIGAAMLTNLATNAGSALIAYLGAAILAFIPLGNLLSVGLMGAIGYILIYASAILYLKLLTNVMKAKGNYEMDESERTKNIIKSVVEEANIKDIFKEGKENFDAAKKSGEFKNARNNLECPSCGANFKKGQKFCSNCGFKL